MGLFSNWVEDDPKPDDGYESLLFRSWREHSHPREDNYEPLLFRSWREEEVTVFPVPPPAHKFR